MCSYHQENLQSKKKQKLVSKRIRKMQQEEEHMKEKEFERAFSREFWPDNVWILKYTSFTYHFLAELNLWGLCTGTWSFFFIFLVPLPLVWLLVFLCNAKQVCTSHHVLFLLSQNHFELLHLDVSSHKNAILF